MSQLGKERDVKLYPFLLDLKQKNEEKLILLSIFLAFSNKITQHMLGDGQIYY